MDNLSLFSRRLSQATYIDLKSRRLHCAHAHICTTLTKQSQSKDAVHVIGTALPLPADCSFTQTGHSFRRSFFHTQAHMQIFKGVATAGSERHLLRAVILT